MSKAAIGFGIVLIGLGLGGYFGTGRTSVTALIPAFFGLLLVILGWVATRGSEKVRMHTMHVAAMLGLLGFVAPAVQALPKLGKLLAGEAERPAAVVLQLVMAAVCAVFLGLCIKSFVDARRNRQRSAGD